MALFDPSASWIELTGFKLDCLVGICETEQKQVQPLEVDVRLHLPLDRAARTGDLRQSVNYAAVLDRVTFVAQHGQWGLLESLAGALCTLLLLEKGCDRAEVVVRKPAALKDLAMPSVRLARCRPSGFAPVGSLRSGCGGGGAERSQAADDAEVVEEVRDVRPGVALDVLAETPSGAVYRLRLAAGSRWSLPVEVAAQVLSGRVLVREPAEDDSDAEDITTHVAPGGVLARGAGVVLHAAGAAGATLLLVGQQKLGTYGGGGGGGTIPAYIALGSNVGDRSGHMCAALTLLQERCGTVAAVSQLYVTAPQHVADQPDFFNAACEIRTTLPPAALLRELKIIERELGRTAAADGEQYGPRVIDLDIVLYGSQEVDEQTVEGPLVVPHQLMRQRTFVLAPMCDIAPNLRHPGTGRTLKSEFKALCTAEAADGPKAARDGRLPQRVFPIRPDVYWPLGRRTYVMGVLNLTPDSFSDGGRGLDVDVTAAVTAAAAMVAAKVDVLDLGAESTRPGAERVTEEEEMRRLLPVIQAIRAAAGASASWGAKVVISVDTSRSKVAAAAIGAGADIINDISGGTFDAAMVPTAARLGVPIVLMHTRGTPKTMQSLADYDGDQVCGVVCDELFACVRSAHTAGLPPWRLIADPGLGFAKTPAQSMQLLRELPRFVSRLVRAPAAANGGGGGGGGCCASLVGASRKGFVGKVLGEPNPLKRQWGNAATVCAAVLAGADIVRVHEVDEMRQVALMSDAIHRGCLGDENAT
eukprot:m.184219 g.184219  ORF g.184219 m.184219 type:complete len:757 (-) comp24687_c0_seq1:40-2310(-)